FRRVLFRSALTVCPQLLENLPREFLVADDELGIAVFITFIGMGARRGCLLARPSRVLKAFRGGGAENAMRLLVPDDLINDLRVDLGRHARKAVNKTGVGKNIDKTGNTAARGEKPAAGIHGKERQIAPGNVKPVLDIGVDILGRQRREMEIGRDALRKLDQLWRAQQFLQLRLADENELQELVVIGIDVGEKAKLLQQFRA